MRIYPTKMYMYSYADQSFERQKLMSTHPHLNAKYGCLLMTFCISEGEHFNVSKSSTIPDIPVAALMTLPKQSEEEISDF